MDSILIATGVCLVFLVFAFALAWADHTTSQWLRDRAAIKQAPPQAAQPDRKAA